MFIIWVGYDIRLLVKFMCTVYPVTGAVVVVVGDGRSGDPLHERGEKSVADELKVA